MQLARTPEPPYYAVIFASVRRREPDDGYDDTARRMLDLASRQPGFLGVDDVNAEVGITVSYWADEAAISAWKRDADHTFAQYEGRTRWYEAFELRVARVERAYGFRRADSSEADS